MIRPESARISRGEEREALCVALTGINVNLLWVENCLLVPFGIPHSNFSWLLHNMVPFDAGCKTISKIALIGVIAMERVACSLQITV